MVSARPAEVVSSQRGVGLVLAIVALVLVTLTVLLLLGLLQGRSDGYRARHRTVMLVNLSDAACAGALARLAEEPEASGVDHRPFGGGEIAWRIAGTAEGRRLVVAEGFYAGWRGTITAEVEVGDQGPSVASWSRTLAPVGDGGSASTGSLR